VKTNELFVANLHVALVLKQFIILLLWSKTVDMDIMKIQCARTCVCVCVCVCVNLLHKTHCEILLTLHHIVFTDRVQQCMLHCP